MIELNKFSVHIIGGNSLPGGYVELSHGATYKIQLRNGNFRKADAYVSVDGKEVGAFRIDENSTIVIERPVDDTGKFTFYEIESSEAKEAELQNVSNFDLGLISVRFELEKVKVQTVRRSASPVIGGQRTLFSRTSIGSSFTSTAGSESLLCSAGSADDLCDFGLTKSSHSAGGTGLSGQSNQTFIDVANIEIDPNWTTWVNVRLVAKKKSIRPLVSHSNIAPQPLHR